ncbi:hypothetical protein [Acidaminobacter sp. JC074]|nr:hypothetical protein [Acidaminobacter sp. JC074]
MPSFEDWEVDQYLLEKKDYKRYLDYKIKEFLNDREDVYRIIEL